VVDPAYVRYPLVPGHEWSGVIKTVGPGVRRFTPDGRLDTVVRLPARQVTSAAFGGPDLGTLHITTAWEGLGPADRAGQPHAGDIFACTPGVTGHPPFLFAS
jgi:sugar lactone lactonase YvrE